MHYWINEYTFKVIGSGLLFILFARDDETVNEMKDLWEQGMDKKLRLIHKVRRTIDTPPYELEQSQLDILIKGLEKSKQLKLEELKKQILKRVSDKRLAEAIAKDIRENPKEYEKYLKSSNPIVHILSDWA